MGWPSPPPPQALTSELSANRLSVRRLMKCCESSFVVFRMVDVGWHRDRQWVAKSVLPAPASGGHFVGFVALAQIFHGVDGAVATENGSFYTTQPTGQQSGLYGAPGAGVACERCRGT